MDNLFKNIPDSLPEEVMETLVRTPSLQVKRILSRGQTTDWVVQESDEWVIVLRGHARLLIEGEESPRDMKPGDYLSIPSGTRHRVEWTDPDETTVWLPIHYKGEK